MSQIPEENDFAPENIAEKPKMPGFLWALAGCGCLLPVFIFGIGILSAVMLPSFFNQATKAKQAEAKQYIGAMNRGQQAFQVEKGIFAQTIPELGIGIPPETTNYHYEIVPMSKTTATTTGVMATAKAKTSGLSSYTGVVFAIKVNGQTQTITGICETEEAIPYPPTITMIPSSPDQKVQCPKGSFILE